jgi:hypothetical protein
MILATADIFQLSPEFKSAVMNLHTALLPVALVVCVAGVTGAALRAHQERALGSIMPELIRVVCVALFLSNMGAVGDWFGSLVVAAEQATGINANPMQALTNVIYQKFHVDISSLVQQLPGGTGLTGPAIGSTTPTISHYGYAGDSTPDPNSSAGVGNHNNTLTALSQSSLDNHTVSLGFSPSLISAYGLKVGQTYTANLATGRQITGVFDDTTSPSYNDKTLYRVDVYDPGNQIDALIGDGTVVTSISGATASPSQNSGFDPVGGLVKMITTNPLEAAQMALFSMFTLILAYISAFVMWMMALLQSILYYSAIAVGPIFAGFLLVRGLENIAKSFILSFFALSLWNIAALLTGLVTQLLISFAIRSSSTGVGGDVIGATMGFLWIIGISVWVITSSILGPLIVSKKFMAGAVGLGDVLVGSSRSVIGTYHTTASVARSTSTLIGSSQMIRGNGSRPYQSFARRPEE